MAELKSMRRASQSPAGARRPVIVETDLSFDDYVALIYLLQCPDLDIRAITVVNGVVYVKQGIENVRRLLALVGRPDIPVAGGPDQPLAGQHSFPRSWRAGLSLGPRLMLPKGPSQPVQPLSAPELIRQQSVASDVPVTFIALGPLTNLALAMQADPTLATRFDTIFISGGALDVPGTVHQDVPANPNIVAEWNFYIDPVAADIVLKSGAQLVLIPLDVTHVDGPQPLLFGRDFVRRLMLATSGRAAKFMVRILRLWQLMWQLTNSPKQVIPVWDAAVAAIVTDPTIGCAWRDLAVRVLTQPEQVAGHTVIEDNEDNEDNEDKVATNVRVCLKGNQAAFEAAYLAAVRRM